MKKKLLLFCFLLAAAATLAAQPITHYRTTNIYLCLPLQGDVEIHHRDRSIRANFPVFVQGFQTDRTEPYTIYGIAAAVCPEEDYQNYDPYTLEGCTWKT
ncbi:MAG: hypothetical protein J6W95_00180, partial [Bacteroidales bacterium]|nr:hypothetical protein [Bacteroidales bacterium]